MGGPVHFLRIFLRRDGIAATRASRLRRSAGYSSTMYGLLLVWEDEGGGEEVFVLLFFEAPTCILPNQQESVHLYRALEPVPPRRLATADR